MRRIFLTIALATLVGCTCAYSFDFAFDQSKKQLPPPSAAKQLYLFF